MATATAAAPTSSAGDARVPGHTIVGWAIDILSGLHVPVTPANVYALVTWANHESGGYRPGNPVGLFNPLNTTESAVGYATQGGSQGNIKGFSSYDQGVQAQVYNLSHTQGAGYEQIIAALQQGNNPSAVFAAIDASSFGTHNLPTGAVSVPSSLASIGGDIGGGTSASAGTSVGTTDALWFFPIPGGPAIPLPGNPPSPGGVLKGAEGAVKGVTGAIGSTAALAADLVGVFSNWRYALELLAGAAMILLGVRIILADTTGRSIVPRPGISPQQGAEVAALAAA